MTDLASDKQAHAEIEAQFSELFERSLPAEQQQEVEAHLAQCEACRLAYEEFREAVRALSGLHKMPAPQNFEREVEETIRRRSAGRFFGRKAFGDRIPFELLAIIVLALGLAIFFLIRSSQTGSLRYEEPGEEPRIDPRAREVVPQPGTGPLGGGAPR